MNYAVVDTNVLLIANGKHSDISDSCQEECVKRLIEQKENGITVIDRDFLLLKEYLRKTRPNMPKGPGDVFLKWLLQNKSNKKHVETVVLTEEEENVYAEFPDPNLQKVFDAPDRKFVAVAAAHPKKPVIWQAADCKWLDWWPALKTKGIIVEFLCPDDACRFYAEKFPNGPAPRLPE